MSLVQYDPNAPKEEHDYFEQLVESAAQSEFYSDRYFSGGQRQWKDLTEQEKEQYRNRAFRNMRR